MPGLLLMDHDGHRTCGAFLFGHAVAVGRHDNAVGVNTFHGELFFYLIATVGGQIVAEGVVAAINMDGHIKEKVGVVGQELAKMLNLSRGRGQER